MKKTVFLILTLFCFSFLFANDNKTIIQSKKADFILDIGSKISYPEASKFKSYKIGVYGKGREIEGLIDELESRKTKLLIHDKPLEIFHFKRMKTVEPVDLLYVAGDSKLRISDLNEHLAGHPYLILTENFPFGTSMFNFTLNKDNEVFFEIQEEILRKKGAEISPDLLESKNLVDSEKRWLNKLAAISKIVADQESTIENQESTIEVQTGELEAKQKLIEQQRTTIVIGILSFIIISGLLFFLYKTNQHRRRIIKELALKNQEITDSINYAKGIQAAILPALVTVGSSFSDSFVLHQPKDIVSGDFYWLETVAGKTFFAVADCTGHGVPGAMLSVICSNSLTRSVKELGIHEPAKILDKTVQILEERFSKNTTSVNDGMDIALCCINEDNNTLEYAGAYNSLYQISDGEIIETKANRQPIGKYENRQPYTNHTIPLKKGDCFYVFSDGYVDQFGGPDGKKFKSKNLKKLLLAIHTKSMKEQKKELEKTMNDWSINTEQIDDICFMGIKV